MFTLGGFFVLSVCCMPCSLQRISDVAELPPPRRLYLPGVCLSVCLSVCLFVRLLATLRKNADVFHEN